MYNVTRSEAEINELRNEVAERIEKGGSRHSGMSFEQGIDDVLRWLFGETDDHPYHDE